MATAPIDATPARLPDAIRAALHTVENLNVAIGEAIRYANDGPLSDSFAFADDAISSAAQGLHDLMRIERPHLAAAGDHDGLEALDHLCHEVSRFLVDWIGERQ